MDKYYADPMRMDDLETEMTTRELKDYMDKKVSASSARQMSLAHSSDILPGFTMTTSSDPDEIIKIDMSGKPVIDDSQDNIEYIDYILDKNLNYCLGNAIKYISNCNLSSDASIDTKYKAIENLRKAIEYLNKEIERIDRSTIKNS